jgi:hypothetical protein
MDTSNQTAKGTGSAGEDRLVEAATRLWRSMEYALPKVPESMQVALKARVEDGDVRWALALLLAGWRLGVRTEPGATEVAAMMKDTGAEPLVQQMNNLQMLFPESFRMFVNAAVAADTDPKLAGAAAYLSNTLKELGDTERGVLQRWFRSAPFLESGRALIRRFPVPGSGRPPVWGSPPTAEPSTRKPSRVDRFDRADVIRRPPPPPSDPEEPATPALAAATPAQPPSPALDDDALARSYLLSLGWKATDVERLMAGPKKSSA